MSFRTMVLFFSTGLFCVLMLYKTMWENVKKGEWWYENSTCMCDKSLYRGNDISR